MASFGQAWNSPPSESKTSHISGMFKKEAPLKPRIEQAISGLNRPISKLDSTSNQLNQKDGKLFQKIVYAQQNKDMYASKALANELVQVRKTNKMVGNMRMSVERTQFRLSTASAVGDAIVSMRPAVNTMKAVVPAMNKVIPQASAELESIGNILGEMMPGSLGDDYAFGDSTMSSAETDSILKEAAAVAETQVGEKFPSVPTSSEGNYIKTGSDSSVDTEGSF